LIAARGALTLNIDKRLFLLISLVPFFSAELRPQTDMGNCLGAPDAPAASTAAEAAAAAAAAAAAQPMHASSATLKPFVGCNCYYLLVSCFYFQQQLAGLYLLLLRCQSSAVVLKCGAASKALPQSIPSRRAHAASFRCV
jgi:hypothetical protein